jgi:hypothetical protein
MRNYNMYNLCDFARTDRIVGCALRTRREASVSNASGSAARMHDESVAPEQAFGKTRVHRNFRPARLLVRFHTRIRTERCAR